MKLGYPVTYQVHDGHVTSTVKGENTLQGSLHHPELTEFAGLIGRVHPDGSCDLVIFPPGREPKWVDGVKEGTGGHSFRVAD